MSSVASSHGASVNLKAVLLDEVGGKCYIIRRRAQPGAARKTEAISLFLKLRVGYLNPVNSEVINIPTRLSERGHKSPAASKPQIGRTESLVLE